MNFKFLSAAVTTLIWLFALYPAYGAYDHFFHMNGIVQNIGYAIAMCILWWMTFKYLYGYINKITHEECELTALLQKNISTLLNVSDSIISGDEKNRLKEILGRIQGNKEVKMMDEPFINGLLEKVGKLKGQHSGSPEHNQSYSPANAWIEHAYPLQQVVIKLQGTRHSDKAMVINQLETVIARLKAGDVKGSAHDDDFGYTFEYCGESNEKSFFDKPFG